MKKRLIATVPILYSNEQYQPGEALPTTDPAYVSAWFEAGAAVWENESDGIKKSTEAKSSAKAQLLTAPAGATGLAQPATGAEENLAGKVPGRRARGAVKEKSKRLPKLPA
ncbi:hypothetical protein BRYFOR_07539 [Marvinbryantia formatexigens DSM 14469]|uniref:Uncharacterized protein n=1 Tax=Marvinbryantia formatexigens DSM 14469 TaxID=478749 RepID=C6LFX9_9FIRM|nr:hypothetical protein [Marvinbryantia formatexigens]EET60343.1 hypothetical protein BRYFOR_07539 [Marvinbryantia formatexigens DSM 14469]UWO25317.1 hypothetical protein NQ534_02140 [Marvinbryantia formatexigens DSM 14469]SDG99053.1 hypothetical protein SAMN05660368_03641 [Marvinbryantia formatexigens]